MKKIAILATHGFEHSELTGPQQYFINAGHEVIVISPESGSIAAAHDAGSVAVDRQLDSANAGDYDALILPGGQVNPDILRINDSALTFIKHFVDEQKPIAAICHAPWLLIEVGAVSAKQMTSWPSLKTDLVNAGAAWVDEPAVTAGNIVTSRNPDDIPAFNQAFEALLQ
jgi:protease I